jgi:hypothetical protein
MEPPFADALVHVAEVSPWLAFALCTLLTVASRAPTLVEAWIAFSRNRRQARYEHLLLYGDLSDTQSAAVREILRTAIPDRPSPPPDPPPGAR